MFELVILLFLIIIAWNIKVGFQSIEKELQKVNENLNRVCK